MSSTNNVGKQLGNYRIIAEIANGGFGTAYQAQQSTVADRPFVAIKDEARTASGFYKQQRSSGEE